MGRHLSRAFLAKFDTDGDIRQMLSDHPLSTADGRAAVRALCRIDWIFRHPRLRTCLSSWDCFKDSMAFFLETEARRSLKGILAFESERSLLMLRSLE